MCVGSKSLSGGENFVTFVDDYTHHVWVYIIKSKRELFQLFIDWKAMVENNVSGRKVKTLRTDNGGEYTSRELYLTSEGIIFTTRQPYPTHRSKMGWQKDETAHL